MSNTEKLQAYVKEHGGLRVIRKILIANNGMGATKAIMSMRQWAFLEFGSGSVLEFVAMASVEDLAANMDYIRLADSFVEVPGGKNTNNYANVPLIVEIAKKQQVDAVWPGWGHASEHPALPKALAEAGITFLGPTAPVMHALGDKIASTILAQSSGVPCIPWNGEGITAEIQADGSIPEAPFKKACLQSCEEALTHAKRIGYPVVLKASEGGGGKGIRKCTNDDEVRLGWDQVAAEVGGPVFMMQLATGARHLEVQLVGDEHGSVVALSGRDCSTQRRFQKIFEEGPPTVAPKDGFREAEKAAQKLAMSVGYRGAGTVEYLFTAATGAFCFLELNPRLQVEHPVTEGITGINVPALQLAVGMGIPLSRVPDIRRFYGLDPAGTTKIDFIEDKYVYPTCHVMAARVTAENPDDSFRPTSGKIHRVTFQSTPNVWGYFSCGANGAIHEFADSQFGHIFAKGPTRDDARKALQSALKSVNVVGEIRNATEYLVELAETKEFRENTIDTAWLDKLIAEKSVAVSFHLQDMVFYAACFLAHSQVRERTSAALDSLTRGHLPLKNDLQLLQSFSVEVAYEGTKYLWQAARLEEESFALTLDKSTFEVRIREQSDGSLYVKIGERVAQISGTQEPMGLRLRVDGVATMLFPRINDPSELRSDFNGKVVRYLQADGGDVAEGEAFVELEAMKMIMSLKATASGKIHHALASGGVIGAGQLLATLDLADPSKVQTVKQYTGTFELSGPAPGSQAGAAVSQIGVDQLGEIVNSCLRGFCINPSLGVSATVLAQRLFDQNEDKKAAISKLGQILGTFLQGERFFAGLVGGNETQVKSKFQGTVEELLKVLFAHSRVKDSLVLISSLLHSMMAAFQEAAENDGSLPSLAEDLANHLGELAALPVEGGYGQVKLLASQLLQQSKAKPLMPLKDELRSKLTLTARNDLPTLAVSFGQGTSAVPLDAIALLFRDDDSSIRSKAAEVFIRRAFQGFEILDVETVGSKDVVDGAPAASLHVMWSYKHQGVKECVHHDYAVIVPTMSDLASLKKSWVLPSVPCLKKVHIWVASAGKESFDKLSVVANDLVLSVGSIVSKKQCKRVNIVLVNDGAQMTHLHYDEDVAWKEVPVYRNIRSCLPFLLELHTVRGQQELTPIKVFKLATVFLAKDAKKTQTVLGRGVSHKTITLDNFERVLSEDLLQSIEQLENVSLNPLLSAGMPPCHILLHYTPPLKGCTQRDLKFVRVLFDRALQHCLAEHGHRFLNVHMEKIEIRVWLPNSPSTPLKLATSSAMGWEIVAYQGEIAELTGYPETWRNVEDSSAAALKGPPIEEKLGKKRTIARATNSTYIYDFPMFFRIGLTKQWQKSAPSEPVPDDIFTAKELVLQNGELVECERPAGSNDVGMVAFLCKMRTPEYPKGREMILIGNDLTIKAGSFGVIEDEVFDKASKLSRARGLPRIYIACNSGARLGVVEELKELVQVAWNDAADPNKGFEYIYIKDEDHSKLPADSVQSHPVVVGGQTRHVLDAILGLNLPSIKGGIGVENLQGSGLIAGETNRAYNEVFSLSYVTGRSVGIGAYLNRLGQRVIQQVHGPMILTGYQALNKLLGQQVYTTQDQLGGPHIMVPNGVTHELVRNDQHGVENILNWLAFVPADNKSLPPIMSSMDPLERLIEFVPTKAPYDPRHMLAGTKIEGKWFSGFCDEGSFRETMEGWGKTVVVGRGRLGGLPIGIVAVETRAVTRHIPADPADVTSQDIQEPQAGQVWYPDSAHKTAQAIRDFNRGENLPLIIFANWRGFSGGTRDMFAEVLKYGAMIVDALVEYKHPVTIYIPPEGELRGGAWVVLDSKINSDQMEMFADVEARGGILEPPAASEICFKGDKHVLEIMHRTDPALQDLDKKKAAGQDVTKTIQEREKLLLPIFRQVAITYCDLHDKSGRMKSAGVIQAELEWKKSRSYLHWRIRRRMQENNVVKRLQDDIPRLSRDQAMSMVKQISKDAGAEDKSIALWLEENGKAVDAGVELERQRATQTEIFRLIQTLPSTMQGDVLRDLDGFVKVSRAAGK